MTPQEKLEQLDNNLKDPRYRDGFNDASERYVGYLKALEKISELHAISQTHSQDGHGRIFEDPHYMCRWCEDEAPTAQEIVHSDCCPTRIAKNVLLGIRE
jgi:hypothetical protein